MPHVLPFRRSGCLFCVQFQVERPVPSFTDGCPLRGTLPLPTQIRWLCVPRDNDARVELVGLSAGARTHGGRFCRYVMVAT